MGKRLTFIMNISEKIAIQVAKIGEDVRRISLFSFYDDLTCSS
jgi:hypothetical protein